MVSLGSVSAEKTRKAVVCIRHLASVIIFGLVMVTSAAVPAADQNPPYKLIFITSDHCPFCVAWEREVGQIYDKSPYGEQAPLFRVDFGDHLSVLSDASDQVAGTPTFLILTDGQEIGRIQGYQSSEMFFWALSEFVSP